MRFMLVLLLLLVMTLTVFGMGVEQSPTRKAIDDGTTTSTPQPPFVTGVIRGRTFVHYGPDRRFALIATIPSNTNVEVYAVDPTGEWYLISYTYGTGWVSRYAVRTETDTDHLPAVIGPPTVTPTAHPITPSPTASATATPFGTEPVVQGHLLVDANLRHSPTNRVLPFTSLLAGTSVDIFGIDVSGTWYLVYVDTDYVQGWISADMVSTTIDPGYLPIFAGSPRPTIGPTRVPTITLTPSHTPISEAVSFPDFQVGTTIFFREHWPIDTWFELITSEFWMQWVQMTVLWSDIEPERGQYDWSMLDVVLLTARAYDIRFLLTITDAPDWARQSGADLSRIGPPADNGDYVNFIRTLLERYPGMIHALEIWREPNFEFAWSSVDGVNPADYVALVRTTKEVTRAVAPDLIIISGAPGVTGFFGGCTRQGCDDLPFIEQTIDAGILEVVDCVGIAHYGYNIGADVPYDTVQDDPSAIYRGPFEFPHPSWSFYSTLTESYARIQAAGSDTPICVTQFGWASSEDIGTPPRGFEFARDNTLAEQAEWTVTALNVMESEGYVAMAFIYNMNFGAVYSPLDAQGAGLYSMIGPAFRQRPVLDSVQSWHRAYWLSTHR